MKFTVLCSVYYKENPKYLNECFLSIWNHQTLRPNEIVLVKDGPLSQSLDQTIKKWQNFLGNILKVIILPENLGLGPALNEGVKHCSYDWIFRMDTDDVSTPSRFQEQVNFILNHPNIVLCGGQIITFTTSIKHPIGKRLLPLSHKNILLYSRYRSPFNHQTIAIKKSILQEVQGYKPHLYMEDYNLWLRLLATDYEVANLKNTLVYMRINDTHNRRRGLIYLRSEWQLLQLKNNLMPHSILSNIICFLIRAISRILPLFIFKKIYNVLHK
jgi:glycosyltransferase involved in cell wall biosynthesis